MNRLLYSLLLMLAMGVVSCNNVAKQETDSKDKPKKEAPKDTVKETENNMDTVAVAEEELLPSDFSKCDMVMLDNGKLFFYNSEQQALMPYEAETDSVVNSVFTNDGYLYYCVPVNGRMMLRCINLDAPDPKPIQIADWGLDYQSCVTETYGTVSPLSYYADRNMLGLWHEFSWDSYSLNEQKLYNLGTGKITDWDWETWEEDPSRMSDGQEETEDAKVDLREFLHAEGDNYWFEDGIDQVCLTDNLDLDRYISDPDYASEREFEFVSSSPDNSKVLYMAILEWGDYPHGPLCVSSVDGTYQTALEDTDCADFKAEWLDDGSLVYVGYEQLETGNEFSKWENSTPCVKRVYPDGSWESFFRGNDFQVRHKTTH